MIVQCEAPGLFKKQRRGKVNQSFRSFGGGGKPRREKYHAIETQTRPVVGSTKYKTQSEEGGGG